MRTTSQLGKRTSGYPEFVLDSSNLRRIAKLGKEHDHAMDDMRYFAATVLGERQEGVSAWAVERRR